MINLFGKFYTFNLLKVICIFDPEGIRIALTHFICFQAKV